MNVLLVEHQAILALGFKLALQDAGYTVLGPVNSPEKALAICAEAPPTIAFINFVLKGETSGVELAQILKQKWDTAVVFISGHSPDVIGQANVALGFLSKPFTDETLVATMAIVTALKEGKTPLPAMPAGLRIFSSTNTVGD